MPLRRTSRVKSYESTSDFTDDNIKENSWEEKAISKRSGKNVNKKN